MVQGSFKHHVLFAYVCVLIGIIARLVPHPPNVTPVAAIALFGGWALAPRWLALAIPLAAVAVSDAVIGWHRVVAFTWGSFALTGLIGWWLRRGWGAGRLITASMTSSTLFFLITNFGVWWIGAEGAYPPTWAGLISCYVAAMPFYRSMLLGDLAYTAALFGGYLGCCWLAERRRLTSPHRQTIS